MKKLYASTNTSTYTKKRLNFAEDCALKQVDESDFAEEYTETTSCSLYPVLNNEIKRGEGSIRLTMSGVEYRIDKYYKEK